MKQIILCVCLLLGVLCSCDKKPINGKLDGRWQLMTIDYNDGSIKECERIYCSIQLHLVELMDKGTTPLTLIGHFSSADGVMMGEFKYQDNMEATVTEEDLNRFGLNSSVTHFEVEKATGSKMILKSDYARLTYRKF